VGRGFRGRQLAEDVVSLVADASEEVAAVVLHTRVVEVVAHLQLMCKNYRGQVVKAPAPIPVVA